MIEGIKKIGSVNVLPLVPHTTEQLAAPAGDLAPQGGLPTGFSAKFLGFLPMEGGKYEPSEGQRPEITFALAGYEPITYAKGENMWFTGAVFSKDGKEVVFPGGSLIRRGDDGSTCNGTLVEKVPLKEMVDKMLTVTRMDTRTMVSSGNTQKVAHFTTA